MLKKCPKCGGEAQTMAVWYRGKNGFYQKGGVKCKECGKAVVRVTTEKAIEVWNR